MKTRTGSLHWMLIAACTMILVSLQDNGPAPFSEDWTVWTLFGLVVLVMAFFEMKVAYYQLQIARMEWRKARHLSGIEPGCTLAIKVAASACVAAILVAPAASLAFSMNSGNPFSMPITVRRKS